MQVTRHRRRSAVRDEDGFTLVMTLAILFISSLLIASALANASGDVHLTRSSTGGQDAYYAAQAGLQVFEYNLNTTLEYWKTARTPKAKTKKKKKAPRPLSSCWKNRARHTTASPTNTKRFPRPATQNVKKTNRPRSSRRAGTANDTFRVKATGYANGAERSIIATFKHPGFLNYVFLSDYEVEDPSTFAKPPVTANTTTKHAKKKAI